MPEDIRLGSLSAVLDDIDDWCGTGRHPHFPPRPHGLQDLLAAIAIGELASRVTNVEARGELERITSNLIGTSTKELVAQR